MGRTPGDRCQAAGPTTSLVSDERYLHPRTSTSNLGVVSGHKPWSTTERPPVGRRQPPHPPQSCPARLIARSVRPGRSGLGGLDVGDEPGGCVDLIGGGGGRGTPRWRRGSTASAWAARPALVSRPPSGEPDRRFVDVLVDGRIKRDWGRGSSVGTLRTALESPPIAPQSAPISVRLSVTDEVKRSMLAGEAGWAVQDSNL